MFGYCPGNYSYLSDGTKLSATDAAGDGLVYRGSLVYRKQGSTLSLESASFNGGRFVATNNVVEPHYFITDHLGSVRAVVDSRGEVKERSDYYPYGLRWDDAGSQVSDNRYRYNGKEDQAFLNVPYTDYGARMRDPRYRLDWLGVDALSEITPDVSPFAFSNNNPIRYVDHFGLSATDTLANVNIAPVVVEGQRQKNNAKLFSTAISMLSFGVTTNHDYMDGFAKQGLYLGEYNGAPKGYSNLFYGNKQMSSMKVAAQKAKFAKKLKILGKLKGIFTAYGIYDLAKKADSFIVKLLSGEDIRGEDIYGLLSSAVGFVGWQGALISAQMDLLEVSTNNALQYYQETGDEETFYKIIRPGPRQF